MLICVKTLQDKLHKGIIWKIVCVQASCHSSSLMARRKIKSITAVELLLNNN